MLGPSCVHLSDCKNAMAKGLVARCINWGHWKRCNKPLPPEPVLVVPDLCREPEPGANCWEASFIKKIR